MQIEDMIRHQGAAQKAADEAMDAYYRGLTRRRRGELAELLISADRNDFDDDGCEGGGGFRVHLHSVERVGLAL